MGLTATYTDASAKVTLAASSAPANAAAVLFERSTDQVRWSTVRGGAAVALSAGAASIDDYEYFPGVVNYFRASYIDTGATIYTASAAAPTVVTAAGASVAVTRTPDTTTAGNTLIVVAACNKSTSTVTLTSGAGWTLIGTVGTYMAVYGYQIGTITPPTPTFTATGTAAGDILIAYSFSMRNALLPVATSLAQNNASAQNINYPSISQPAATTGFMVAYKANVSTSVTGANYYQTGTGYTALEYLNQTASIVAGFIPVTGGVAAISGVLQAFTPVAPFVTQDTANVTPAQTLVWLKNPLRPYLNRSVNVIGVDDVTRDSRSGTFDIIARTLPVAVVDVRGGRASTLHVQTTSSNIDDLESCLGSGEVVFLQPPGGQLVTPRLYALIGQTTRTRPAATGHDRYLALPFTEVAAPDASLAAVLSTWQTVISAYPTWAALVAAKATWADVLLIVGTAADVVTT